MEGYGTFTWPDKRKYTGCYLDDKKARKVKTILAEIFVDEQIPPKFLQYNLRVRDSTGFVSFAVSKFLLQSVSNLVPEQEIICARWRDLIIIIQVSDLPRQDLFDLDDLFSRNS